MQRVALSLAVLIACLLVAWLIWRRKPEATSVRTEGRVEMVASAPETGIPTLDTEASTASANSPRVPVASAVPDVASIKKHEGPKDESGGTLVVRAIDKASGVPLSQLRAWVWPASVQAFESKDVKESEGTIHTAPVTGSNGQAEFQLPAGIPLRLSIANSSRTLPFLRQEIPPLTVGERRSITLELPATHFFARVVARDNSKPISKARFKLVGEEALARDLDETESNSPSERGLIAERVSPFDGLFALWLPTSALMNPTCDLRVDAHDFTSAVVQLEPGHETPARASVIPLSRSATIHARIHDAGGVPAGGGFTLSLSTQASNLALPSHGESYIPSIRECYWAAVVDSGGRCVLHDLPPAVELHVVISCGEVVIKRDLLTLIPGEEREVEWNLGSGCRLEGLVVDQESNRVQGEMIWMQRAFSDTPTVFDLKHGGWDVLESKTDAAGRFAFGDLSAGRWWIGPAASDDPGQDASAPFAQVVEVMDGSPRQGFVLQVQRGLYIKGRVLSPTGEPVSRADVLGRTGDPSLQFWTQTQTDGSFSMGPLVAGRYQLLAQELWAAESDWIEASGGDTGIVIHLNVGGSVQGQVIDGATENSCSAELWLRQRDARDHGFTTSSVSQNGQFVVKGLSPGVYDLVAIGNGQMMGVLGNVPVQAGTQTGGLQITTLPSATLRLRYVGKNQALEFRVLSGATTVEHSWLRSGSYSMQRVPSGHIQVEECRGKTWKRKEFDVVPGEIKDLVFGGDD